jgi:hypothetical protein
MAHLQKIPRAYLRIIRARVAEARRELAGEKSAAAAPAEPPE